MDRRLPPDTVVVDVEDAARSESACSNGLEVDLGYIF